MTFCLFYAQELIPFLIKLTIILIQENEFQNVFCELLAILFRPQCVKELKSHIMKSTVCDFTIQSVLIALRGNGCPLP